MTSAPTFKYVFIIAFVLSIFQGFSQESVNTNVQWADSMLADLKEDELMDSNSKLALIDSIFNIYKSNNETCKQVNAGISKSGYLDNIGKPDSALKILNWASNVIHEKCDSATLISLYINYTSIYLSLEELERLDSIAVIALKLCTPSWKDPSDRFSILTNVSISQAMQGNIDEATETFRQIYHEARAVGDTDYTIRALNNLGTIKGMTEDFDSAYYFLNMSALEANAVEDKEALMPLLINLANVDMERENYAHADMLLDSALAIAEELVVKDMIVNVYDNKSAVYENTKEFEKAYIYLREYTELREELLNEERVRAVAEMMEKYQSELKAGQIQQLRLEQLDSKIENERITNTRNQLLFLGGIVILIALGLWSRLLIVRKSRKEIQREKDVSDNLLLNILPASVAEELKEKGKAEARYFDTATILFSDFKDFTVAAGSMQAADLVDGINTYFKAFDEITSKFGVEKIKTIGDSYMAAGGIDDSKDNPAIDVVCAAIELQRFVMAQKLLQKDTELTSFDMRVGVHSGPVVAGIVGIKKFQYDLWGDTVNIASRMENNGRPEKVNISEATYQLIKDDEKFKFEARGMIDVRGKGNMKMYFVEHV